MDREEGRSLLQSFEIEDEGLPSVGEAKVEAYTSRSATLPGNLALWASKSFSCLHRHLRTLSLVAIACVTLGAAYLFTQPTITSKVASTLQGDSLIAPLLNSTSTVQSSTSSPFTGPFARIPRLSTLPKDQQRMTIVGAWNDDAAPAYLHQFFYSMQMNADVLDLIFLNRMRTNESKCVDFEKHNINITWGGNVKVACIAEDEWKRRHVDFMCGQKYGWNCNATEYDEVTAEWQLREDESNYNWRPFRGFVFRDLFPRPELPFWAWMDHDLFVGDFRRYPFNILSQLSLLTGNSAVPENLFMAGQLTAFNFNDPELGAAWKKFPELQTPAHFTQKLEGEMPRSSEERYWSYGYLRSRGNLPGQNLSIGVLPDIYGDDFYNRTWNRADASQIYVVSGRDILLVEKSYSREEIEIILRMERNAPIDDLGNIGWTAGDEALVDDEMIGRDDTCSTKPWRQCIEPHPLTISYPPALRATYVHFTDQRPGHIWRRLERDTRAKGYERKLIRHHLKTKKMKWFEFPPFPITEDMVLRYNSGSMEVFKMGEARDKTLYYRKEGEKSIG